MSEVSAMASNKVAMKSIGIVLLASVASCDGCTVRTPNVCCTSDAECARLGLPPGSASEYSCSQGQICRDFYCVPETDVVDAPAGRCNPNASFGTPRRVFPTSSVHETDMALMADELSAFVIRDFQVQMSFRTSLDADFPLPTATGLGLEALQGSDGVSPAPDGLTVYVTRPSFIGVSYRPTASSPFTSVSQVNVDAGAIGSPRARLSADSMTLYWSTPDHTFHEAQRLAGTRDVFITALEFTTIEVLDFAISADDLTLYWSSSSPGAISMYPRGHRRANLSARVSQWRM